jgi:hypothetical protein
LTSEAELIAQAEIGEEGRKFLESDLGKTLLGLADQERQLALEDLAKVTPTDSVKIAELQLQAKFGEKFREWLFDLISDGDNAISVFKQQSEG